MLAWNGVHDLDFMRCVCGEVARVRAFASRKTHVGHDYPDAVFVELEFHSGAVGIFQGGFFFPLIREHPANEVRIVCERGGVSYSGSNLSVESQSLGGEKETRVFPDFGFDEAYRIELSSFIGWIRDSETPVLTGEDGLRCVEIMEAAYRSLETGGFVDLPL
jgi:predicted dehydrogenase